MSLLDGLDPEQRVAAGQLLGPLCILAGAGTGKTRTITHRIAHGVEEGIYNPGNLLALTFTTKAAGELRQRLRTLGAPGIPVRTFHAEALSQLSHFWPQFVGGGQPRLLEGKSRFLGEAAERVGIRLGPAGIRDVATELEWRKTSELSLDAYPSAAAGRPMPRGLDVDAVASILAAYEEMKDERRRLDFEDVLLVAAGMLETETAARERVRERYRFFVVDEYQDVSPLQHRLLGLWLGGRHDVCVVGDANQTIYTFAGASSRYLLEFEDEHPGANVVRLERSYRSAPAILGVANGLMRGRPGSLELRAARASRGDVAAPVAYPDDAAEAGAVARAVAAEVAAGADPASVAVLYRVNEQATALDEALAAAGVVTRRLGATRFFDIPAVRKVVSVLAVHAQRRPGDPVRETVADAARDLGWTVNVEHTRLPRAEWVALDALVGFAEAAPDDVTMDRFAAELAERAATDNEPPVRAVVLSTLHAAKGLEWDSVHLVGLAEGLLPVVHARGAAAIEEERRLLYVGITRARRRLALSWARRGPRGQERRPSRFLEELRTSIPGAATRSSS